MKGVKMINLTIKDQQGHYICENESYTPEELLKPMYFNPIHLSVIKVWSKSDQKRLELRRANSLFIFEKA